MGDALIAHSAQKTDESKRLSKKKKTKEPKEFKNLEVDWESLQVFIIL